MEDLTLPVLRKNMFGGTQSVGATSIDFSYLQNIRGKDLEDAKGRYAAAGASSIRADAEVGARTVYSFLQKHWPRR